jgi:hypothetical protein
MLKEAKDTIGRYKETEIKDFNLSNYGLESYKDINTISIRELLETDYWKNMSANEILNLYRTYKKNEQELVPITVWKIEDILFITTPAEMFVEYSLNIKSRFKEKYRSIIIVELANGWVGYVPTKKAFSYNSGYEVQFLTSSKLCENAGDIITEEIIEMEKELDNSQQ